jgi:hypothetical protein
MTKTISVEQRALALTEAWTLTQDMLAAARDGDWDELIALQDLRHTALQALLAQPANFLPDEVDNIHKILHAGPTLEALTLAQRNEVGRMLKEATTGRNMAQSYGDNSGW